MDINNKGPYLNNKLNQFTNRKFVKSKLLDETDDQIMKENNKNFALKGVGLDDTYNKELREALGKRKVQNQKTDLQSKFNENKEG